MHAQVLSGLANEKRRAYKWKFNEDQSDAFISIFDRWSLLKWAACVYVRARAVCIVSSNFELFRIFNLAILAADACSPWSKKFWLKFYYLICVKIL